MRVIRLVESLPRSQGADVIGRQLVRCATSVGANYRAARRAGSRAEFMSELGIVEEEVDEAAYRLDLLGASGLMAPTRPADLARECDELTAIVVATIRSTKRTRP